MNATSTALEDPWTLSHSQARIDTFPRLTVTSSPRTKRRKANAESTVGTQIGVFPRHDRAGVQVRGSPKLSAAPNMLCFYAGFSRFTPSRGFARLRAALTRLSIPTADMRPIAHRRTAHREHDRRSSACSMSFCAWPRGGDLTRVCDTEPLNQLLSTSITKYRPGARTSRPPPDPPSLSGTAPPRPTMAPPPWGPGGPTPPPPPGPSPDVPTEWRTRVHDHNNDHHR